MAATSAGSVLSLPGLLRRDRALLVAALVAVTALSWLYLWRLAVAMEGMAAPETGGVAGLVTCLVARPWTASGVALSFVMWWVMMIGMMLPGAAPMVLTFATINQRRRERGQPFAATAVFAAGYLAAWGGFGLVAALVQAGLEQAALTSPAIATSSRLIGGGLFVAAGLYQFAPVKDACLEKCRSPLDFVLNHWRDGRAGALVMGLEHGAFCIGCCWMVMLLMFAGGVMNLLWAVALTIFVLVEKLLPGGLRFARLGGVLMTLFGAWLVAGA